MANLNAHRMLQGHCLQLACLAVLHLAVHIHAALTEWLSLIWQLLWHATAAILHKVSGDRVRVKNAHQHSGKAPPAPRVLAAVLAETDLQAMPVEQVAALVGMCACAGLTDVSVYDPSGFVRRSAAAVGKALWAAQHPCPALVALQVGSLAAPQLMVDTRAAEPGRSMSSSSSASLPAATAQQGSTVTLRLLSAADSMRPLLAAACQGPRSPGAPSAGPGMCTGSASGQREHASGCDGSNQACVSSSCALAKAAASSAAESGTRADAGRPGSSAGACCSAESRSSLHGSSQDVGSAVGRGPAWGLERTKRRDSASTGGHAERAGHAGESEPATALAGEGQRGGGGGAGMPDHVQCLCPTAGLGPAEALDRGMAAAAGPAWAPEPELILVFGQAFTLAGFPPWRLRLAEVYHMGPLRALTAARFGGVLRQYRRTHQRFGT